MSSDFISFPEPSKEIIRFVSNLLGEEAINAMTVAGISLIIAGFCNLMITNKNAITYQAEEI